MTSYPCPYCHSPANLTSGCPGCGRGPDPDAAEVVRLDAEIPVLAARLADARVAVTAADDALRLAWRSREAAVARIRVAMTPRVAPAVARPAGPPPAPRTKEASTKLVQNVLFTLGGLLLGVAAIVFTAVAWAQFGVGGRALLLAGFTVVALALPFAALRRNLRATAETFAAVGLLLVLLDGYAAWYVNLFGVADYSALGYAGAVCAVTAAVAAGYEHVTGLAGPRFAALIVAQPVLPLLAAPFEPGSVGWAYTFTGVAALNLVVIHLRRSALSELGVTAYAFGGIALALAGLPALVALADSDTAAEAALAASALVASAGLMVTAAVLARVRTAQAITGGLFVVALALAAGRFVAVAGGSFLAPVLIAAVVAATAVLVTVVNRLLPAPVRRGPWIGALVVAAGPAVIAVDRTLLGVADWRLPAVIALVTAALVVLVPRALQPHVLLGGAALLAHSAPAGFGLYWWTAAVLDLVVVAAALAVALRVVPIWPATVAAALTVHAVVVALESPGVACATLAAVAALGVGTAAAARRDQRTLGGVALTVGLLAVPAAAWAGAVALSQPAPVQSRVALAAVALLVGALHLTARGYRTHVLAAVLLAVVSAPAWAYASGDSPAIYAAVGLLLVALTFSATIWAGLAALPLGSALLGWTAPSLFAVLLRPYGWLGQAWTGTPDGTGVGTAASAAVVALGVFAVAVTIAVRAARGLRAATWAVAPILAVLAPAGLAAAGVPWPGVPAASLLLGLAGLLAVALLRPSEFGPGGFGAARAATGLAGAALTGAGLAGSLPTAGATLAALGLTVVAGAVAGVSGRGLAARLSGWLGVAAGAVTFAFSASRAAGLPLDRTAFAVLGTAAVLLGLGTALAIRRPYEGRAVQVAAHAGAFVALLFAAGSIRYAALVCTLWGLALGLRALRPGEAAAVRRGHVIAALLAELCAWWLLIAAVGVATVEAYTLPAAAVALFIGWLARRDRGDLSSWIAYGPALAAALLPTLASVLTGEAEPLRRLLLGLGALAVLLAGAHVRLQAPVVAGGGVLVAVALHEAALVWDLLPRWIPLAMAGLLLVGLAMTLERRRRDLARVRAALTRMG
ncbi:SCO7613 C-terminal domain-containing membrane protein [Actinoplanes sp. NPDC049118]|uniref:SCO7613 C-terminal domain-containing membrane protein n=1 Tax=Actinoplanes sp. NPDC049118 TaxID=3155769 RepID=UPI0033C434F9